MGLLFSSSNSGGAKKIGTAERRNDKAYVSVHVEYCGGWGYYKKVKALANQINNRFQDDGKIRLVTDEMNKFKMNAEALFHADWKTLQSNNGFSGSLRKWKTSSFKEEQTRVVRNFIDTRDSHYGVCISAT